MLCRELIFVLKLKKKRRKNFKSFNKSEFYFSDKAVNYNVFSNAYYIISCTPMQRGGDSNAEIEKAKDKGESSIIIFG